MLPQNNLTSVQFEVSMDQKYFLWSDLYGFVILLCNCGSLGLVLFEIELYWASTIQLWTCNNADKRKSAHLPENVTNLKNLRGAAT